MEYNKLPAVLKRYLFDEKMRILQHYSKQIMNIKNIELNANQPMAWELETFLLFSVKACEYKFKDFKGKNANDFIQMINCIREYKHPILISNVGKTEFVEFLLIALGSTQFDIQTFSIYKYYRYNYFFNYVSDEINMKDEFYKKFKIDYELFLELGLILNIFCSLKVNLNPKILEYIMLKYSKVIKLLTISREKFKEEIDKFSNDINDYLYCVRPSYIYPFIEYKKEVYFPLPHCMTRATADSLLYRLTDSNSSLRTAFGKNVLEDYLYEIVSKSNLFDESIKEQSYINKKKTLKTSDIMCRANESYLFFECKATVPYAKTRCMDKDFISRELNKISDSVIQLYKQVYSDFKTIYYPFEKDNSTVFNCNNCFGIVVLLEESYIRRELIYEEVAKKLEIRMDDERYNWIINHIKVCSLYDIEKYCFSETSIIDALNQQMENNMPHDYSLSNRKTKPVLKSNDVNNFKKELNNIIKDITNELINVGILTNDINSE